MLDVSAGEGALEHKQRRRRRTPPRGSGTGAAALCSMAATTTVKKPRNRHHENHTGDRIFHIVESNKAVQRSGFQATVSLKAMWRNWHRGFQATVHIN